MPREHFVSEGSLATHGGWPQAGEGKTTTQKVVRGLGTRKGRAAEIKKRPTELKQEDSLGTSSESLESGNKHPFLGDGVALSNTWQG